jgi:hypothetical protein
LRTAQKRLTFVKCNPLIAVRPTGKFGSLRV